MDNVEREPTPYLPGEYTNWADAMLLQEYVKHADVLLRAHNSDNVVHDERGALARRIVERTEWYWLQQILFRLHVDLSLEEMSDKRKLNERLLYEQRPTIDPILSDSHK